MSLATGTKLGPYEILSALGAGGMGEVYRARDTKLNRDVAIKVLLPAVAHDSDRLARFGREAQVLASLNHPNIAAIYGIEESNAVTALVMELVEGEDLSQRISRGPIPLDEALPIARQIAEALEAAHDHGIIHRDLKPANIKVRPDGTVKVLDFGLAKAIDPTSGASAAAINSPTLSIHGTQAGIILGTAAYMAPEQAKGRPVDKRADVWAFAVVLYEMLTGVKAFPGEDISDTLATLLKFEPDWNRLPADTPPSIRRLLKRCLMKDPKARLRECGSAIVEIDEATSGGDAIAVASAVDHHARRAGRSWVMPAIAAMSLVALAAVTTRAMWGIRAVESPTPTRRFTITLPASHVLPQDSGTLLALSPDGRTLVYRANPQNAPSHLFRRPIDQFDALILPGTENGGEPLFFSPDGQWFGFGVDQTVKKIPVAGGPSQTLSTKGSFSRGGSWGPDGSIVVGDGGAGGSLFRIPEGGGTATALFKGESSKFAWYPQVLPGGKLVLFTDFGNSRDDGAGLHVLDLNSGSHRTVVPNAVAGRVLPSGHLVFMRGATLWAVPFDSATLTAVGTPVPVVDGVRVESGGAVQYTVSDEGTLAYIPGALRAERTLAFVNNDGRSETLTAPPRDYQEVALSPDETRVAVQIGSGAEADVWVVEVARGTLTRVTSDPGFDGYPLWSKDGTAIVFASSPNPGQRIIQRKSADGTGEATPLGTFDKVPRVRPNSWSPDGRTLVVEVGTSIATVEVDGKSQPKPLIESGSFPAVSPDGRWLAYSSSETGGGQVYLQRFPGLGDRRVVSGAGGGYMPAWSRDGGELFYLRGGSSNAVMRVKVKTGPDGRADIGTDAVLTAFRYYAPRRANRIFEVPRDPQRVLIMLPTVDVDSSRAQINVVTNWFDELKRLVPIK